MSDYITLLGAEQVQRAAGQMQEAAHQMQRAADAMQWSFEQNQRFMEDWLGRFSEVVDRINKPASEPTP